MCFARWRRICVFLYKLCNYQLLSLRITISLRHNNTHKRVRDVYLSLLYFSFDPIYIIYIDRRYFFFFQTNWKIFFYKEKNRYFCRYFTVEKYSHVHAPPRVLEARIINDHRLSIEDGLTRVKYVQGLGCNFTLACAKLYPINRWTYCIINPCY